AFLGRRAQYRVVKCQRTRSRLMGDRVDRCREEVLKARVYRAKKMVSLAMDRLERGPMHRPALPPLTRLNLANTCTRRRPTSDPLSLSMRRTRCHMRLFYPTTSAPRASLSPLPKELVRRLSSPRRSPSVLAADITTQTELAE
ncbi:hypothetical protein KIPB_016641, partial [Kipferlia bialata]